MPVHGTSGALIGMHIVPNMQSIAFNKTAGVNDDQAMQVLAYAQIKAYTCI